MIIDTNIRESCTANSVSLTKEKVFIRFFQNFNNYNDSAEV